MEGFTPEQEEIQKGRLPEKDAQNEAISIKSISEGLKYMGTKSSDYEASNFALEKRGELIKQKERIKKIIRDIEDIQEVVKGSKLVLNNSDIEREIFQAKRAMEDLLSYL